MKRFLILLIVTVSMCVSATGAEQNRRKRGTGNGNIIEKSIDIKTLDAYEGIQASHNLKVVVTPEIEGEIRIAADDNLIECVTVRNESSLLRIGIDSDYEILDCNITVTVPLTDNIKALIASAAAQITGKAAFTSDKMGISASSAARINAAVKCGKCTIACSSAGKVTVATISGECHIEASSSGKAEVDLQSGECEVDASSAAKVTLTGTVKKGCFDASSAAEIYARQLEVHTLEADASSSADIEVWCTGELYADASSGGTVLYKGDCRTHIVQSSGGHVRKN